MYATYTTAKTSTEPHKTLIHYCLPLEKILPTPMHPNSFLPESLIVGFPTYFC